MKTIYTIGHSTHSIQEFLDMLKAFKVELLVDVRSLPGSRKFPQFIKENLDSTLNENDIEYYHLATLGGRRKSHKNSKNIAWHHPAFRSYADYMETNDFNKGLEELEILASKKCTVIMCSEALWWRCHRSMIADAIKFRNWSVQHIINKHTTEEHPYTQPARIENNQLVYTLAK